MSIMLCFIPALIVAGLCAALPYLALTNLWRIPEMLDMPDITPVLAQLQDAAISLAWPAIAACGLVALALALLLRRHKITAALLIVLLALVGAVAALLLTYVNGVPVHTMVRIALDYLQSGAF